MASADSCLITAAVTRYRAEKKKTIRPVRQASPDKNVIFHYITAAFTASPESVGFVMLC
jgi:hypothetical protein